MAEGPSPAEAPRAHTHAPVAREKRLARGSLLDWMCLLARANLAPPPEERGLILKGAWLQRCRRECDAAIIASAR